jgi:hypothetical protein
MTSLFLDLVQDLREKRLWPVAVALLAATAAVPLLLLKPAHNTADTPHSTASGASSEALPVVNVSNGTANQSSLKEFSEKNPFKPMSQLNGSASGGAGKSTGQPTASTGGSGGGGSVGSGGSGGGATGGTPSGGSGGGSADPGRKYYAFRVNVRFGPRGHEKTYKDVKQLGMLPNDKSPVVVFMGMSSDFKTAIFLIDTSKYNADGEGKCRPSTSNCSFVELNVHDTGNEETLAAPDGSAEYTLKLTGITRVFLTPEEAKGDAKDQNSPSPKGKGKAKAAVNGGPTASGGKDDGVDALVPLADLFELPSFASQP